MIDKYAVFGHPIGHSKSPYIHQAFAKATGQAISYEAILAPIDGFEQTLREFMRAGGKGANVTVPFKEEAFRLCDHLSEEAKLAGAVNTLTLSDSGLIYGDNTDGQGLVADLQRHLGSLSGKRVLLIGAGGAARGSILPLLDTEIASLTIYNRTHHKAVILAELFCHFGRLDVASATELTQPFDIIINSTSASLSGELPQVPEVVVGQNTACYDMMYAYSITPFNQWGEKLGARMTIDGLGMLVGQAAKSFKVWRGIEPAVEPVLLALRQELAMQV